MKAFNLLPSSPILQEMNDAQWIWSYLNLLEDQKEEEDLWKARLKYMGLFVNPDAVKELSKLEEKERNPKYKSINNYSTNSDSTIEYEDDSVYTSSTFEEEMKKAMGGEDFMELPDPDEVRGNPNMSSDDFLLDVMKNIDQFSAIQQELDLKKQVEDQGLDYNMDYDLDIIQVDD